MAIEENRRIAEEFFRCIDRNDVAGALALLADDVNYWIIGDKAVTPSAGDHDKAAMSKLFHIMFKAFKDGLRMRVLGTTTEADRVALEVESRGELKNGRVYQQKYHILMTIRDGRIAAVREYLDTQHVYEVWFKPETAKA